MAKLGRHPGETDAAQEQRLIAFYATTCADLAADQVITENDYKFWRRAFAAAFTQVVPAARGRPATGAEDAAVNTWALVLQRIEPKVDRHTFHTWFVPLVQVTDTGPVIEVTKHGPQSGLFATWIAKHYGDLLRAAVEEVRPGARVDVIDVCSVNRKYG